MTQLQFELDEPGSDERFTPEQRFAIDRREGDLLLDAGAGSGKTTVLVERFVRSVAEDQIDVGQILAITFTEKAAAELRERIRHRLREVGLEQAARATESAWISTIHGFCARVVHTHALHVGLDPEFVVLDAADAARLAAQAFEQALALTARSDAGADLIAAYGPGRLSSTTLAVHGELRSRGLEVPSLPACLKAAGSGVAERSAVGETARSALRELGVVVDPGKRVSDAITLLETIEAELADGVPWPSELDALRLGDGAGALRSDACDEYRQALQELRAISESIFAGGIRDALDALLREFSVRYEQLKHARSALDFEDLELFGRRLLLEPAIGARYRERFARVMVDEMQDTNRVQLELIDAVGAGKLFMVGDAQQSIYGFRHADVELFQARGRSLAADGARASLQTNFRSTPGLLNVINAAFANELGAAFQPLVPGRDARSGVAGPPVELLIVDRAGDFEDEGTVAPWRLAEARVLAAKVAELLAEGAAGSGSGPVAAGDIVVLTRATTDLPAYERALAAAKVPTFVVGGRGYWEHPQVLELTSYLRALANPLDQAAWYATLLSPICGLSLDGLVLVAANARAQLTAADRLLLEEFEAWFATERTAASWLGAEELIDRALTHRDYEAGIAGLPDARRRIANVRKLMRLAREWEAGNGPDLRGFVDLLSSRAAGDDREGEAPVESEALNAVRLMSIHRSKGLEFPVVCIADLGRLSTARGAPIVRIGRGDQRFGLRIGRPGTAGLTDALDYAALKAEQAEAEAAEERRLFYVAMTRAKERLILSGAAQLFDWGAKNRFAPIGWLGSALAPEIGSRLAEGQFTTAHGVEVTVISADSSIRLSDSVHVSGLGASKREQSRAGESRPMSPGPRALIPLRPPTPATLSYSAIAAYERCGYRFYVEQVLGLGSPEPPPPPDPRPPAPAGAPKAAGQGGALRGIAIHELLREIDFAHPERSTAAHPLAPMLDAFLASPTAARLRAASDIRREQPFAFLVEDDLLVTGAFDVLAREAGHSGDPAERLLVVDYKSDRLDNDTASQERLVESRYDSQRLIYALAALRSGASEVEVAHLFLERPEAPVARSYLQGDRPALEAALSAKVAGQRVGDYRVTDTPGAATCAGCPAADGLCSYPLEVTQRP